MSEDSDKYGETSLKDLAEENIGEFETYRLEYVIKTLKSAEKLENDLSWNFTLWKDLTVEELIGGLLEAENLLERSKEEWEN